MYAGKMVEMAGVRDLFNHPAHPYTQSLMKAVPKVEDKVERLASIEGEPPQLHNVPPGCAFASRCSGGKDRCDPDQFPPIVKIGEGHWVNCWRYV